MEKIIAERPLPFLGTSVELSQIGQVTDNRARKLVVPSRQKKKKQIINFVLQYV